MTMPETTLKLFYLFTVLRPALYLPQIAGLAKNGSGLQAVSIPNLIFWIGAYSSTAAYGFINISNWVLTAVGLFNAVCCIALAAIALYRRRAQEPARDVR
jgi:hypothetical protein